MNPFIESLERRDCRSVSVEQSEDSLLVTGDENENIVQIEVSADPNNEGFYTVFVDSIGYDNLYYLDVYLGDGNDELYVDFDQSAVDLMNDAGGTFYFDTEEGSDDFYAWLADELASAASVWGALGPGNDEATVNTGINISDLSGQFGVYNIDANGSTISYLNVQVDTAQFNLNSTTTINVYNNTLIDDPIRYNGLYWERGGTPPLWIPWP